MQALEKKTGRLASHRIRDLLQNKRNHLKMQKAQGWKESVRWFVQEMEKLKILLHHHFITISQQAFPSPS